jgi:hypothetical protein
MDEVDFIITFENGEATDKEIVDGFANLVKSGMAWSLQGTYGRIAKALIEQGYINKQGEVLKYPKE